MSPRLQHPVLNIQQIPRKPRFKKHTSRKLRQMAGLEVEPLPVMWTPYRELTDEQKKIFKSQSVANYNKYYHSKPKFNRHVKRMALVRYYDKIGEQKTCIYCNEEKSLGHFDKRKDKRLGKFVYRSYCSECRKQKNKEYYRRRKETA